MKFKQVTSVVITACLALGLAGCFIASVHPLAEPKDRILDRQLLGVWIHNKDTLTISGQDIDNLKFEVAETQESEAETRHYGSLDLMLTRIQGINYMDIRPSGSGLEQFALMEKLLLLPMHGIIRYQIHDDTLTVQHVNYENLNKVERRGRAMGLHVERLGDNGPLLITSSTKDIRNFLKKYQGNPQVFEDPVIYLRAQ
jgi:hypothetical protein